LCRNFTGRRAANAARPGAPSCSRCGIGAHRAQSLDKAVGAGTGRRHCRKRPAAYASHVHKRICNGGCEREVGSATRGREPGGVQLQRTIAPRPVTTVGRVFCTRVSASSPCTAAGKGVRLTRWIVPGWGTESALATSLLFARFRQGEKCDSPACGARGTPSPNNNAITTSGAIAGQRRVGRDWGRSLIMRRSFSVEIR